LKGRTWGSYHHFRLPPVPPQQNGRHCGTLQAQNLFEVKDTRQIYGATKSASGHDRKSIERIDPLIPDNVMHPGKATEAQDEVKVKK
jgi:hypothetical protein